jgi:hypothetical protein
LNVGAADVDVVVPNCEGATVVTAGAVCPPRENPPVEGAAELPVVPNKNPAAAGVEPAGLEPKENPPAGVDDVGAGVVEVLKLKPAPGA